MTKQLVHYFAILVLLCGLGACSNDSPNTQPNDTGHDASVSDVGKDDDTDSSLQDVLETFDASKPPPGVPSCGDAVCSSDEVCEDEICVKVSCDDGIQNGVETDIDCGGPTCEACWGEQSCKIGRDCKSGACIEGQCTKHAFVMVWSIFDNPEFDDGRIKLPLVEKGNYKFRVDWGDGTADIITRADQPEVIHQYEGSGKFTVSIEGVLEGWSFYSPDFAETYVSKLREIKNWGVLRLGKPELYAPGHDRGYFAGANNLKVSATDIPDLTGTVSLQDMFINCGSLESVPSMNEWDVSSITNMSGMFRYNYAFNQDIGDWDVSSVSDMARMFEGASRFNQDIGGWDVSSVTNTSFLFSGARDFNQDIGGWDVSSVTTMLGMFNNAKSFNQDIGDWDVSSVDSMTSMFFEASAFDQDIGKWEISSVTMMSQMFGRVSLSTANYDALLLGWSSRPVSWNVPFDAGNSTYSVAAEEARNILTNETNKWSILDGGLQ